MKATAEDGTTELKLLHDLSSVVPERLHVLQCFIQYENCTKQISGYMPVNNQA